jgi:23S rRNA pseudouridine1911/1915/1917 synthase
VAPAGCHGDRLDRVLAAEFSDSSRARLQSLIKAGEVRVNGSVETKPRRSIDAGDRISVRIPPEKTAELLPETLPLVVLFEDEDLIVIDKPAGLVVHPAAGNPTGTLVNALLHHCGDALRQVGEPARPGIVHRLDKDTSGCLVAAKSEVAYQGLTARFSNREVEKTYRCVVSGVPSSLTGRIENRIGRHPVNRQRMALVDEPAGKLAITDYAVVATDPDGKWSAIRCELHTGRTHQIRVHMKESLRCPILGDEIYAQKGKQSVKTSRLMLHARRLAFRHPRTDDPMAFESSVPPEFERFGGKG